MICYRITKYNPIYRSATGAYEKNEWTSFSDIGTAFDNHTITYKEYMHTEDAYINAIIEFAKCTNTTTLQIKALEKHTVPLDPSLYTHQMQSTFKAITNNQKIDALSINNVSRLALRENIWCKLESATMYVHFGYDYYMYIGCAIECNETLKAIQSSGLFVELYRSPYLD